MRVVREKERWIFSSSGDTRSESWQAARKLVLENLQDGCFHHLIMAQHSCLPPPRSNDLLGLKSIWEASCFESLFPHFQALCLTRPQLVWQCQEDLSLRVCHGVADIFIFNSLNKPYIDISLEGILAVSLSNLENKCLFDLKRHLLSVSGRHSSCLTPKLWFKRPM